MSRRKFNSLQKKIKRQAWRDEPDIGNLWRTGGLAGGVKHLSFRPNGRTAEQSKHAAKSQLTTADARRLWTNGAKRQVSRFPALLKPQK